MDVHHQRLFVGMRGQHSVVERRLFLQQAIHGEFLSWPNGSPFRPATASSNALTTTRAAAAAAEPVSRLPLGSGPPWAAVAVVAFRPPPSPPPPPSPLPTTPPFRRGGLIRTGLGLKKGMLAWPGIESH